MLIRNHKVIRKYRRFSQFILQNISICVYMIKIRHIYYAYMYIAVSLSLLCQVVFHFIRLASLYLEFSISWTPCTRIISLKGFPASSFFAAFMRLLKYPFMSWHHAYICHGYHPLYTISQGANIWVKSERSPSVVYDDSWMPNEIHAHCFD